jgi:outer membrane protein TolC
VLYVVIRSLAPGRGRRDRTDDGAPGAAGAQGAVTAVLMAIGLTLAAPAFAQVSTSAAATVEKPTADAQAPAVVETVTFDEAITRALAKNPTVAIAATNILRSEALLEQARAVVKPRVSANVTNTTLDTGREFGGQTVQPQNQSVFGLGASMPVIAAAQWAARTQAMDQVEIARLSVTDTRRQIAVATASAYLAIIAQQRQVDVALTAIETARGQLEYNTRRREGGVGSRLNELR